MIEYMYTGCDAIAVAFNMLGAAVSVGTGPTWRSFALTCSVSLPFYTAQWAEYHTSTMSSSNGYFGVTEGQLILIVVHFITGFFGL